MPRRPAADSAAALRRGTQIAEVNTDHKAVRRTTLPGGLRVVTEHLPAVRSASVGVWVGVGSRDEGATVAGAAHFLEHLLFKSTPTRTAVEIAQAMDAVGGELNAFTAREQTCYYAHVLDSDLELAIDLVADVVLNGRCAAEDVELERDVVLEEIAMRDDDPEDALGDIFLSALFGDHPVGRPVIGTCAFGVGDDAGPAALLPCAALHPGADGRRGGRQRRSRRGGRVGARALRRASGPRAAAHCAAQGRRAGHRTARADAGQPGCRADPLVVGRPHPRAWLGASLGAVGAAHRPRWRPELQAVPGGSGVARPGLLGLFGGGHLRRQRRAVRVRRVPARALRRRHAGDQRGARIGGPRRHHRGGMPHRQGVVARRARPRPGGLPAPG